MSSSIQEDRPYSGHAHLSWSPGDARQTLVGCVEKEDGSQEGSWVLLMAPHLRAIQEVLRMRSWWDHLAPATEWLSGDTSLSYGSFLAYEISFSLLVKSIILIKPYFNVLMLLKISFFFFFFVQEQLNSKEYFMWKEQTISLHPPQIFLFLSLGIEISTFNSTWEC